MRPPLTIPLLAAMLAGCATPRPSDEDDIAVYEHQGLTHDQAVARVLAEHEARHPIPPDLVNQAASDAGRRPVIGRDGGTAAAVGWRMGF